MECVLTRAEQGKHIMCKCKKVNYGHQHTVARNYMDEQYNWLQQLIKLSDLPDFKPECSGGQQKVNDAANKYKTYVPSPH